MAQGLDVIDPSFPDPPAAHDGLPGDRRHSPAAVSEATGARRGGVLFLILALLACAVIAGWSQHALALDGSGGFATVVEPASRLAEAPARPAADRPRHGLSRLHASIAPATIESPRRKLRGAGRAPPEALVAASRFAADAAARPRRPECSRHCPPERARSSRPFMPQGPPSTQKLTARSSIFE